MPPQKHPLSKYRAAYGQHKRDASRRGITFLFTFEEWYNLWLWSGKLEQRGRKKGQYVMARYGDKGPYSIANCKIILCEENHSEGSLGKHFPKSDETKQKLRLSQLGVKESEETKKKLREIWRKRREEKLQC